MRSAVTLSLVLALTASACAGVLGIRPPGRRPFEHRAHVVNGIACLKCHSGVATTGDVGPMHIPDGKSCTDGCHASAHEQGSDCSHCHGLAGTRAAAAAAREALHFDHGAHMPRTRGDCVRCHMDVQQGSERLLPSMGTCLGCHEHADEMVARKCDGCHVDLEQEGIKPQEQWVHGPDFTREHGVRAAASGEVCASCHSEKFCVGCHAAGLAPTTPAKLKFNDPFSPSVHRAGFLSRHADEARGQPGLCTLCHSASTCSTCHENSKVSAGVTGARNPHPSTWLGLPGTPNDHGREARRDPVLCAGCHGGAGEKLCIGCHKVGGIGGNPHPPGYVARGNRTTDAACRSCHGGGP